MADITLLLIMAAIALNGILAGASLDQSIKRIGVIGLIWVTALSGIPSSASEQRSSRLGRLLRPGSRAQTQLKSGHSTSPPCYR